MNDLEALSETAVEHHQVGSLVVAKALYKQILRKNPQHIGVLNNLGAALDGLGLFDEAISCFRKPLAIRDDSVKALNNLGSTLHVVDRLEEAGDCFRRAFELAPSDGLRIKLALLLSPLHASVEALEESHRVLV